MKTQPKQDPRLGVLTPCYAAWAHENLAAEEFEKLYGRDKKTAKRDYPKAFADVEEQKDDGMAKAVETVEAIPENVVPVDPVIEDGKVPESESEIAESNEGHEDQSVSEVEADLKDMHHKTFKKKYGMTKDEYKTKAEKEVKNG